MRPEDSGKYRQQSCGISFINLANEIFDINQDGNSEIIVSSLDKTLRVLKPENGEFIWGQIFLSGITTFEIGKIDILKDHVIAAGAADGSLRVFNGSNGISIDSSANCHLIQNIYII